MTRRSGRSPKISGRSIAILAGGLLVGAVSVGVSLAAVTRATLPRVALTVAPWDAGARANLGSQLIKPDATPADIARARTLAMEALRRTPLSPAAWRILGFAADFERKQVLARRYMQQAGTLSRRDLFTRIWLIEDAVRRNDLRQALHHYDIAMRTSIEARTLLFPILRGAMSDPSYRGPIAEVFRRKPNWLPQLVLESLESTASISDLALILAASQPLPAIPDTDLPAAMSARLASERRYDEAYRFLKAVAPTRAGSGPADVDGQFRAVAVPPPFGWSLTFEPERSAERREGGGVGFSANSGAGGVIASKLMLLAPGSYRLDVRDSVSSGDRFGGAVWLARCAPEGQPLVEVPLPRKPGPAAGNFVVPAKDCPAILLQLVVRASQIPDGTQGSVGSVALSRTGAAS